MALTTVLGRSRIDAEEPAGSSVADPSIERIDDRVRGLLLGSLIGDALGGPIEFQDPERVAQLSHPPKRWRQDEFLMATYALGLFDNGWGKDLNAAVVAGLAQALAIPGDVPTADAWESIFDAMRRTDPYRYGQVPWVTRSVDRWLELALGAARAADDRPARLFARLETEFRDTIKWEAQVPFVVTFAVLALSEFDPLAALQLSLEWGHDTDSYGQLVGAFIGARHGAGLFPESLTAPLLVRLRADYGDDPEDWVELLRQLRRRSTTTLMFNESSGG